MGQDLPEGVVLVTGPQVDSERLNGLDRVTQQQLLLLANTRSLPLLVEADGAHMRSLKAPAEHEPAIPPFIDQVVVVAALSALGQPLTDEWVHRSEIFSTLSGLPLGAPITPQALLSVLSHSDGGLKNIPPTSRRTVLLTQIEMPELQAQAGWLAEHLLPAFNNIVISAPPSAVYESVAGIILAAGESRRFGSPKQLLKWRGLPLVSHVAHTALEAGLSPVIVVTGYKAHEISEPLVGLDIRIVENREWSHGQSTSVQSGIRALPPKMGAAIFLLADQPQIPATLVRNIVERHRQTLAPIIAPQIDGQRGNPVLFDQDVFPAMLTLNGDQGGRALFSHYPVTWVPWHDASLLLDVDTPGDYQKLVDL
jgi:molybdenum cofactor cytidylyltransferase